MRLSRRWQVSFSLILAALFIYLTLPLLVRGTEFLLLFLFGVLLILSGLPQMAWWAVGVIILIFWGLSVLINLGMGGLRNSRKRKGQIHGHDYRGRFWAIQQSLLRASSGRYSQGKVRYIFRILAIDLISLKLDIPEEEARQRFHRGDWTENRALKAYFLKDRTEEERRQGLWKRFKRTEDPSFLRETQEALDRLKSYSNFSNRRKNFDLIDPHN